MFKHLLIISWRNIIRNKFYSGILVTGLAVGVAASFLLSMYTWNEMTYDNFHQHKDRIYLVGVDIKEGSEESKGGWTTPPTGPALKDYFPQVETFARICLWFDDVIVSRGTNQFAEKKIIGADSSIFKVFTIPFVKGDPNTALVAPNSIVITETIARKYFGDEDPLGQTMKFEEFISTCTVTGVVKDYPDNSHFDFEILFSLTSLKNINFDFSDSWGNHTFTTYVLLHKNADPNQVTEKLPRFVKTTFGAFLFKRFKKTYDEYYATGDHYKLFLMPLYDVHLSTMVFENQEGKEMLTYALAAIAVIIIVLCCINYTNLATALSLQRAKEVGIRKVTGSRGFTLFKQFIIESMLLSCMGIIIGIVMVECSLPFFNALTQKSLHLPYRDPQFIFGLIGIAIILGTLSGLYPALTFASFNPIRALKGGILISGQSWLRNALVIFQFSICIIMIVCTLVVYKQLKFMTNANLGFDKDNVVVIRRAQALKENMNVFKNELLENPNVLSVSFSNTTPGRHFDGHGQHLQGSPETEMPTIFPLVTDEDILKTLSLKLLEGKPFEGQTGERPKAILNESAVRQLHIKNPLETKIDRGTFGDQEIDVIGVVKDFHYQSFHHNIQPMVIYVNGRNDVKRANSFDFILVKIKGTDYNKTLSSIESTWKKLTNDYPYEFSFLDQDFSKLFEREQITGKVYTFFSCISIFIASIGLLGLASFFTQKRTKEIGIRKIVGADIFQICFILVRQFVIWIGIAVVIGSTVSLYLTNEWANKFAYRAPIDWLVFVIAALGVLLAALLALSGQVIKAATKNPVEALRTD